MGETKYAKTCTFEKMFNTQTSCMMFVGSLQGHAKDDAGNFASSVMRMQ